MRGHVEWTKRSREPKYIPKFKSSIRNDGSSATTRRYGGGMWGADPAEVEEVNGEEIGPQGYST